MGTAVRAQSTAHAADLLSRWRNFQECLLLMFRSADNTYSVELEFDYVWDADGRIRKDLDETQSVVTLRLIGVDELRFSGALTDGMKESPEQIDWGLSEVAGVTVSSGPAPFKVDVAWERQRSLTVLCQALELEGPDEVV